jgi:hypothetical protein
MGKSNTPENKVKAEVISYLKKQGIKAWSNPSGAVQIRPGKFMSFGLTVKPRECRMTPGGRILCIKCKAPEGGRLSPEQKQYLAEVCGLGGLAIVAKGWQGIDAALRRDGIVSDGSLFEGDTTA